MMPSQLSGPKSATLSLRAMRTAFIVETLEQCLKLVEIFSLTWCGRYACIVPFHTGGGIAEPWWEILRRYDPDRLTTLVDLDEDTQTRLRQLRRTSRHARHEDPIPSLAKAALAPSGSTTPGVPLYTALVSSPPLGRREDPRQILVPTIQPDREDYAYVLARFGALNEAHASSILARSGLQTDLRLASMVPIVPQTFTEGFLPYVLRSIDVPWRRAQEPLSLIDLTLYEVTRFGQPRPFPQGLDPSEREFTDNIIVVSREPNIDDFCWFWNLRAQRDADAGILPLWAPYDALLKAADILSPWLRHLRHSFLVSDTVLQLDLLALASRLGDSVTADSDDLDRFYASQLFVDIPKSVELQFADSHARVPVLESTVFEACSHNDVYFLDLALEDVALPELDVLFWGRSIPPAQADYVPTRTGLSFQLSGISRREFVRFQVPTAWQIVETYADEAGFAVSASDKGQAAGAFLNLLGGTQNSWILSDPNVHALFSQLSRIRQSEQFRRRLSEIRTIAEKFTGDQIDDLARQILQSVAPLDVETQIMTFSHMKNVLHFQKPELANDFIRWLISRSIIFRGRELRCPKCQTHQWLYLEEIRRTMHCTGCQQDVDIPLEINTTSWQYRLNSLCALAYEQGVIPHLLTLFNRMDRPSNVFPPRVVSDYYPGLLFSSASRTVEVDAAWIEHDGLIAAECKSLGDQFQPVDIRRCVDLAVATGSRRFVLASLLSPPSLSQDLQSELDGSGCQYELLGPSDLQGQYPSRALFRAQSSQHGLDDPALFEQSLDAMFRSGI